MRNAYYIEAWRGERHPAMPVPGGRIHHAWVAVFLMVLFAGFSSGNPGFAQATSLPPAPARPVAAPAAPPNAPAAAATSKGPIAPTGPSAQGGSSVVVTTAPAQLSAAAIQGQAVVRTLTFRSSQALAHTQLTVPDIPGADMRAVLPGGNIQPVRPLPTALAAEQFLSVPLKLDLHGVPSGQYTGQVFLSYAGGLTAVPVSVSVKDPPWGPLLLLLLGIVTGLALSVYRAQGQPRDEIILQIGRLYQFSQSDRQLPASFQSSLHDLLADADTQIKSAQWDAAKLDAAQAQAVWDKWNKDRTGWLAQLNYLDDLAARIEALPQASGGYLDGLLTDVRQLTQGAASKDSPAALAAAVLPVAKALTQYMDMDQDLKIMGKRQQEWPVGSPEAIQYAQQIEDLRRELDQTDPDNTAAIGAMRTKITAVLPTVKTPPPVAASKTMAVGTEALLELSLPGTELPVPPEARPADGREFGPAARKRAQDRLKAMQWISYSLVVLLLAGSGFGDLYAAKPTFGSNGWADYFGLIAWGLGSHAASVAAGNWLGNLPGIKQAASISP